MTIVLGLKKGCLSMVGSCIVFKLATKVHAKFFELVKLNCFSYNSNVTCDNLCDIKCDNLCDKDSELQQADEENYNSLNQNSTALTL